MKVGIIYHTKKTLEQFLQDARLKHGDRYDYSKVIYIGDKHKVEIVCRKHGSFWQMSGSHLAGRGCANCAQEATNESKRLGLDEVIANFRSVHGDRYDYSKIVSYENVSSPLEIVCRIHGSFFQPYARHYGSKTDCPSCTGNRRGTTDNFLRRAKEKFGDKFDYSRVVYVNNWTKVEIGCPLDGFFMMAPSQHLKVSYGCPKCGKRESVIKIKARIKGNGGKFKNITGEEWLARVKEKHGDEFDYSRVKFVNMRTKVEVGCKVHGFVMMSPHGHLYQGDKCPLCHGRGQTTEDFIAKAIAIHGDTYDYSQTVYTGMKNKVKIGCKQGHGVFEQIAASHILGGGKGCDVCGGTKRISFDKFVVMARQKHGDKYIYDPHDFASDTKDHHGKKWLTIECIKHGKFNQRMGRHLTGDGCFECSKEQRAEVRRTSFEDFVEKANKVHNGIYKYVGFVGTFKNVDATKIEAVCSSHGNFVQSVHSHLAGNGCAKCSLSKGERKIREWLDDKKVEYEIQKKFDACRNTETNRHLKFDFFVPKFNALIEYDGPQHFEYGGFVGKHKITKSELESVKKRDKIKNKFAKDNGFSLIRIRYDLQDSIPKILTSKLQMTNCLTSTPTNFMDIIFANDGKMF